MNIEEYKTYTTDDFILDEGFRKIINNHPKVGKLTDLLNKLPEKKREIKLAAKIIQKLQTEEFKQPKERKQELWQQLLLKQKRKVRLSFIRYAASIIILVGIGSAMLYFFNQKPEELTAISDFRSKEDALLVLSDGKTVSISSEKSTVHYSPDGSGITVNDTSGVAQTNLDKGTNTMIVPYGKRSFLTLSEGTKVWLNSGSKLIFPPVFHGKSREVILEGEALFDVAEDPRKPFYVNTDLFNVKVYGTKFNMQAYQFDKEYNIVLVEGKVSMSILGEANSKEIFLAPSQKASILREEKTVDIKTVEDTEIYTAWVDGYLTFINEDVSDVLKRVSRYYNVEIFCELPEDYEKIYGKLDLKTEIERVLAGIAFISNSNYQKNENKYVFMSN